MADDDIVLAAYDWPSNAELIADVARLGYIKDDDRVLDPTYGAGTWWKKFCPTNLVAHNRNLDKSDFRNLPYPDGSFDVIAFDPPYVAVGGRTTTGIADMHDRYGLTDAPTSPAGVQALIEAGLNEMNRLVKPKGYILVKCQDYISSGQFWNGTYLVQQHAYFISLRLVDRFEHISGIRPQPPGRRQVHARRNLSTLFVFQKATK
jgi:tRNA G10  N-methylase Trm11